MDNQLDVIVTIGGGADGYTPVVGANANWWINGFDTGIKADYSSEESLRAQEEVLRVNAERLRVESEELRISNELTREREFILMQQTIVNAMTSLQQLSASVEANESDRNSNEESRIQNEADRESSESSRELNETNRIAEETKRNDAETMRGQQEEARKTAETNRVSEENKRKDAETLRVQQENLRKSSETNRVAEENKRIEAERLRAEKDAGRDAKIKNVEDKTVQLEQDLNLMRGDVQGVQLAVGSLIRRANIAHLHIVIKLDTDLEPTSKNIFRGTKGNTTIASMIYQSNIQLNMFVSGVEYVARINHSAKKGDVLTLDYIFDRIPVLYLNGVKAVSNITSSVVYDNNIELLSFGTPFYTIQSIRTFNTIPTDLIIYQLYNQGRCDEVVLGDEWRNPNVASMTDFSKPKLNPDLIDGYYRYERRADAVDILRIEINAKLGQLLLIKLNSKAVAGKSFGYFINDGVVSSAVTNSAEILYKPTRNTTFINIANPDVNFSFDVKDITVTTINILNEYLPSFLSPTGWIDTGINKNYIALTAPTFSYVRPYKQTQFASGAPTTPPQAAGQQYFDTVTGRLYISRPISSPIARQFEVADWGTPISK